MKKTIALILSVAVIASLTACGGGVSKTESSSVSSQTASASAETATPEPTKEATPEPTNEVTPEATEESEITISENEGNEIASNQNMSQDEILGQYVEKDTGAFFRVEDEYIYVTNTPAGFWNEPLENAHVYSIEGNKLTTAIKDEGWDSFEITPYGSGYCLSNEVYSFIPFDDYYTFEHTTINKVTDKTSCDGFSISLLDVEDTKNIDILEYVTEIWVKSFKDKFILEAPDDKCFIKMRIKLENEGKEAVNASDALSVSVVYDDSYVFNSYETTGNSLIAEPDNYCYVEGKQGYLSGELEISPLSSREFTVYMLCPSALMEDTDKSLYATFSLKGEKGIPTVLVYDLRS